MVFLLPIIITEIMLAVVLLNVKFASGSVKNKLNRVTAENKFPRARMLNSKHAFYSFFHSGLDYSSDPIYTGFSVPSIKPVNQFA